MNYPFSLLPNPVFSLTNLSNLTLICINSPQQLYYIFFSTYSVRIRLLYRSSEYYETCKRQCLQRTCLGPIILISSHFLTCDVECTCNSNPWPCHQFARKTRNGCKTCKQRKVNCDEEFPMGKNWTFTHAASSSHEIRPSIMSNCTGTCSFDLLTLEQIHRYTTTTSHAFF
ncbi:hypothetical protein DFS33DRAFT_177826 [Desarmillaria ectypa]|nr:hypothetical protein DFS33DRAFT_177826 [Desarmillaria ectypa]